MALLSDPVVGFFVSEAHVLVGIHLLTLDRKAMLVQDEVDVCLFLLSTCRKFNYDQFGLTCMMTHFLM